MLKKILLFLVLGIFLVGTGGSVSAALYEYSLDITLESGYAALATEDKIGGVEFFVTGGSYPTDWTESLGSAVPSGQGWIFENFSGYASAYDNYDYSDPTGTYNPIVTSGNIITLFSDVQLAISDLGFFDRGGDYLTIGDDFTTDGFTETLVPIPSTILLLGGGLVALVGLRRRRS
jgi:hypothetical protein